ncbi:MAG: hypothetical protein MJ193_02895 [Clostridia bacterium]|nr:hypothetical protein [Clostridia bacterium]
MYERAKFLSLIADNFEKCVAVAGTHGKTTTTAMICHILKTANKSFTGHIGGKFNGTNLVENGNKIFVTEACEYKKSLLALNPSIGVVLNAEYDHPDCYESLDEIRAVFVEFLDKCDIKIVPFNLYGLICKNAHMSIQKDENRHKTDRIVVLSNGETHIYSYKNSRDVCGEFCIYKDNKNVMNCTLLCVGEYNKTNALFATAVCDELGVLYDDIKNALASFQGVERRFENAGKIDGAQLIFDYAHHPTEIENSILTAKKFGRVVAVFQPHTFSRTQAYCDDFVKALSLADGVIIASTYPAREKASDGMTSEQLFSMFEKDFKDKCVCGVKDLSKIAEIIKNVAKDYDVVLCLGAGDIYSLKGKLSAI